MFGSLWETMQEKAYEGILSRLYGPAFLFWTGGLAVYALAHGISPLLNTILVLELPVQAALVVGGLLWIAATDAVMDRLSLPILRFMEGYWPSPPLGWLRLWLTRRQEKRLSRIVADRQELVNRRNNGKLTPKEALRLARRDRQIAGMPPPGSLMPTSLGNRFRAAERQVVEKYGLDPIVCWPRLWLLLPDSVREPLQASRSRLDRAAQAFIWGWLFLVWSFLSPWVVLLAAIWIWMSWRLTLQASAEFCLLMESTFDTHRLALYDVLGWRRPQSSDREVEQGALLSEFLYRGTSQHRSVSFHWNRQGVEERKSI